MRSKIYYLLFQQDRLVTVYFCSTRNIYSISYSKSENNLYERKGNYNIVAVCKFECARDRVAPLTQMDA